MKIFFLFFLNWFAAVTPWIGILIEKGWKIYSKRTYGNLIQILNIEARQSSQWVRHFPVPRSSVRILSIHAQRPSNWFCARFYFERTRNEETVALNSKRSYGQRIPLKFLKFLEQLEVLTPNSSERSSRLVDLRQRNPLTVCGAIYFTQRMKMNGTYRIGERYRLDSTVYHQQEKKSNTKAINVRVFFVFIFWLWTHSLFDSNLICAQSLLRWFDAQTH